MRPEESQEPSAVRKSRPSAFWQVFGTLFVIALVFSGLELWVRMKESRRFGPNSLHSIALRDPFTAWRNNPAYGRVDRRINSQGFRRDDEVSLEKPPNTIRIFLTGGSVAYGWTTGWPEIDNRFDRLYGNQTISSYLERDLNAIYPRRNWEVINAAVVGYQLNLELAQTESVLLRYRPDCIIYLDGHNDLLSLLHNAGRNYDPYVSTPTRSEFELLANPGSLRSLLVFTAAWMRENSALFRKSMDALENTENAEPEHEAGAGRWPNPIRPFDLNLAEQARFQAAEAQLGYYPHLARQIHRLLDLDGAKAIFVLQPELLLTRKRLAGPEPRLHDYLWKNPALFLYAFQQLYPEVAAKMALAAQQDGFVFRSLTGVFDQTTQQTFTDDCHLTPEGNRIIADQLFSLVEGIFEKQAQAPESSAG